MRTHDLRMSRAELVDLFGRAFGHVDESDLETPGMEGQAAERPPISLDVGLSHVKESGYWLRGVSTKVIRLRGPT